MAARDETCINTLRILSAEAVQQARSGHPGMPMGAAGMAYILWTRFLRHDPRDPLWPDRDRFVLSAGHGSMLLYSLLHLSGYELDLGELRRFRQWGSRTPGHPEFRLTPGVEVTTGPLGQGFAHAVGMALAERFLASQFNRPGHTIVDHDTYVIAGDGDMMEGVTQEAASLAGHLQLGRLIVLYDDNQITIEGPTSLAFSDDTPARFAALGWHVQTADGADLEGLAEALEAARAETVRPSLIQVRTHIGHGSPNRQDTAKAHGEPLGEEELAATKAALGWPAEPPWHVPAEARAVFAAAGERGTAAHDAWRQRLEAYGEAFPAELARWRRWQAGELPAGWREELATLAAPEQPAATRVVSGQALNLLSGALGNLVGGSADLGPSNNTVLHDQGAFRPGEVTGPNLHFGVREHAMGAAVNGLALHGGVRPYCGTFLTFSDYMRPAIRLAAMMELPVIYVFTHDSIGLGEDGPTHQPIEHLATLRALPGLTVIRPADARETREAWEVAVTCDHPVALVLTRQKLAPLPRTRLQLNAVCGAQSPRAGSSIEGPAVARGAYIFSAEADTSKGQPAVILIASGSELALCLEAQAQLESMRISTRVVSMPSWELFEAQSEAYRQAVLPPLCTARLAVEAALPLGWERYVGPAGATLGMTRFGASAPATQLFAKFGFMADEIATRARRLLNSGVTVDSGA